MTGVILKEPGSTPVTGEGVTLAIVSELIRLFLVKVANRYVTSQGHGTTLNKRLFPVDRPRGFKGPTGTFFSYFLKKVVFFSKKSESSSQ